MKLLTSNKGQLIMISGVVISIALVTITIMLNNVVYSGNVAFDASMDTSKYDIVWLIQMTISEVKEAADDANEESGPNNATFYGYMSNYSRFVSLIYASRGQAVSVNVSDISIGFSETTTGGDIVVKEHTFPNGSLIIPMGKNQTEQLKAYGLVYRILNKIDEADDFNTSGQTTVDLPWNIPVHWLFQQTNDSTNSTGNYSMHALTYNTADGFTDIREYAGGPFLVNGSDIDDGTKRSNITDAASEMDVSIHILNETRTFDTGVLMRPPKWALDEKFVKYIARDAGIGADWVNWGGHDCRKDEKDIHKDCQIVSTYLIEDKNENTAPAWINIDEFGGDNWFINGNLTPSYDALLMDHPDFNFNNAFVTQPIITFVEGGGYVGGQCKPGAEGLDAGVNAIKSNGYGFIGVDVSDNWEPPFWILTNNSSLSFGQIYSTDGTAASGAGGSGKSYQLLDATNPSYKVISYYDKAGGVPNQFDDDDYIGMIQADFPFDGSGGVVRYLAGHNQEKNDPDHQKVRLALNQALYGVLGKTPVNEITSANVTITFSDGITEYNSTLQVPV